MKYEIPDAYADRVRAFIALNGSIVWVCVHRYRRGQLRALRNVTPQEVRFSFTQSVTYMLSDEPVLTTLKGKRVAYASGNSYHTSLVLFDNEAECRAYYVAATEAIQHQLKADLAKLVALHAAAQERLEKAKDDHK